MLILAFHVAGKSPAELVEGRIASFGTDANPVLGRVDTTVGGRQVTLAYYRPLDPNSNELLYAKGDTLFSVRPIPADDSPIPPEIEAAVAALP